MIVVITNCTNRKRGTVSNLLSASTLDQGSIDAVSKQWIDRLKIMPADKAAREVYCGRGFREAEASAHELNAPLYVVSAGLGIVESNSLVPVYDLTVSLRSPNSIADKVLGSTTPQSWWTKISQNTPYGVSLLSVLGRHPNALILIALSRPYIELLREELAQISPDQGDKLRFFGKNLEKVLLGHLENSWMPYDDRIDRAGQGYSGTQTDFAQRTLRHFVKEIIQASNKNACAMTHRSMVSGSLARLELRKTPMRSRLDDFGIFEVIRCNWARGKGQSSSLLRILRHELGIACEQFRFRKIYHEVRKTIGAKSEKNVI